jgi:hypothetical protein
VAGLSNTKLHMKTLKTLMMSFPMSQMLMTLLLMMMVYQSLKNVKNAAQSFRMPTFRKGKIFLVSILTMKSLKSMTKKTTMNQKKTIMRRKMGWKKHQVKRKSAQKKSRKKS